MVERMKVSEIQDLAGMGFKSFKLANTFAVGDEVLCLPHVSIQGFERKDEDGASVSRKPKYVKGTIIFVSNYFVTVRMEKYSESFSYMDFKAGNLKCA